MVNDKKSGNGLIDEYLNSISHENLSLFAFLWTVYFARLGTGGVKDNFYEIQLYNSFFTTDIIVTINKEPTKEEINYLKDVLDFDVGKALKEFEYAGLIHK